MLTIKGNTVKSSENFGNELATLILIQNPFHAKPPKAKPAPHTGEL